MAPPFGMQQTHIRYEDGDTGAQHMLALLDRYRTPDMTGNTVVPETVHRGESQPPISR